MHIELASINDLKDIKKLYEILFVDMSKLQPEYFRVANPNI